MIRSFADSATERVWRREHVRGIGPEINRQANRKLIQLNSADKLDDMRVPPGNRLEKLKGSRSGQFSIRVNDQYRICFNWTPAGPADVELVDYHS